ncbi:hypothetical protein ACQUY5_29345 [Bacillus cereus]|uniref:hypothetical protein n=1 Tax=Bacillus cereus TaxID=1396 RepID=UPI003D17F8B4
MAGELQVQTEDLVLTWDKGAVLVGEVVGRLGNKVSVREPITKQVSQVDESKMSILSDGFVYLAELGYMREIDKKYPLNIRGGVHIHKVIEDLGLPQDEEVPSQVLLDYMYKRGVENEAVLEGEGKDSFTILTFMNFVEVLLLASMEEDEKKAQERIQANKKENREKLQFEGYADSKKVEKTEEAKLPNNVVPFRRK